MSRCEYGMPTWEMALFAIVFTLVGAAGAFMALAFGAGLWLAIGTGAAGAVALAAAAAWVATR